MLLRSIFVLQSGLVAGRLLYLLFSMWYINRYLGLEAKGAWVGIFSLFGILSVCSNMGFEIWMSRAAASGTISAVEARRFLIRVKGPLWLICITVGVVSVIIGGQPTMLALPFAIALILDGIGVAQQAVFEGKKQISAMTLMSFLKSGGFALAALVLGFMIPHPALPFFGWLFAFVLLARIIYGHRCWRLLPLTGKSLEQKAYRDVILMGAYTLVTVLYFKIDVVMLSYISGDIETGNYGNAYDFVEGVLFLSGAVAAVLYPRLVESGGKRREHLFDRVFQIVLVAGGIGTLGFWLFSQAVGTWIAGEAFAGAVLPLAFLAAGLPFMFGNGLLSRWLFATGRERFALQSAAFMALFNIAGNAVLIPRYGAEGAAVMTLATEGLLFFIWVILGRREGGLLGWWLGLALVCGMAGYLYFYVNLFWTPLIAGFVLLGLVFIFTLYRARHLGG